MDGYELLDVGGAARLERFGEHITDRPHPGVLTERRTPDRWADADLRFDRDGGWSGPGAAEGAMGWLVDMEGLRLELRTTSAGQVGLFPEHAAMLPWLTERIEARATSTGEPIDVLHLFAYTGLTTLAMARAGAAVAHVDGSRPSVAWARRNATASGLTDRPVRWLVDDARDFAARELRRGRRYHGVVLDPPTYGHGGSGRAWRLEDDLGPLLAACRALLVADGFMLLTAHTEGFGPERLADALEAAGPRRPGARSESGDLDLVATDGRPLTLGAFTRWDGAGGASS